MEYFFGVSRYGEVFSLSEMQGVIQGEIRRLEKANFKEYVEDYCLANDILESEKLAMYHDEDTFYEFKAEFIADKVLDDVLCLKGVSLYSMDEDGEIESIDDMASIYDVFPIEDFVWDETFIE